MSEIIDISHFVGCCSSLVNNPNVDFANQRLFTFITLPIVFSISVIFQDSPSVDVTTIPILSLPVAINFVPSQITPLLNCAETFPPSAMLDVQVIPSSDFQVPP
ncbi:hypothetical protein D3C75_446820 [compost metagenome]